MFCGSSQPPSIDISALHSSETSSDWIASHGTFTVQIMDHMLKMPHVWYILMILGVYSNIWLTHVPPNGGVSSMEPAAARFPKKVKVVHFPNTNNALYDSYPSKVSAQHSHWHPLTTFMFLFFLAPPSLSITFIEHHHNVLLCMVSLQFDVAQRGVKTPAPGRDPSGTARRHVAPKPKLGDLRWRSTQNWCMDVHGCWTFRAGTSKMGRSRHNTLLTLSWHWIPICDDLFFSWL